MKQIQLVNLIVINNMNKLLLVRESNIYSPTYSMVPLRHCSLICLMEGIMPALCSPLHR